MTPPRIVGAGFEGFSVASMRLPMDKHPGSRRDWFGYRPRWVFGAAMFLALAPVRPAARAQAAQPGSASSEASSGVQGAQADTSEAQQAPAPNAVPLPKGKKLVMNDGTFQIVREYTRQGDRVRYYSLERSDWEEMPASLVNWDATQKAEAERQ